MNLEYLLNLNENQKEAVSYLDGPLLIVAGAGSGKTRVLTSRIAHIIKKHKAFPKERCGKCLDPAVFWPVRIPRVP